MICIELSFTDDPRRMAGRPAHRERLSQLHEAGKVLAAGPWADDSGALIVLSMDRPEADRYLAEDPYLGLPGVRVVSVREWTPLIVP